MHRFSVDGLLDGYLDLYVGRGDYKGINRDQNDLFRNNGSENHYLRVRLTGTRSNRYAVGARLIASAGALRQMRELNTGNGFIQDEYVVHFGLGAEAQVDSLEIRWPSGQIDLLTDIPADRTIRVIEGRGTWYPAERSVWTVEPSSTLANGETIDLVAVCKPALFEPDAENWPSTTSPVKKSRRW